MKINFLLKSSFILIVTILFLNSCGKQVDAKKFPPNPKERVKKNLEEGRGFRISDIGESKGGIFDFASSNELWRASLDIIDFMPLSSANYSGGIIITDWYSSKENDHIKITLRFLSNEVRSDAIDIKVFYKNCDSQMRCIISESNGTLKNELKKEILKKAVIYKKQNKDKNFKPYDVTDLKN